MDTNLLLLFFVALFEPQLIARFKRTQQFDEKDAETLSSFFARFGKIWATPTILAEVSSLSGHLGEPKRLAYFQLLSTKISLLQERYRRSAEIAMLAEFPRFGLADASIIEAAGGGILVLTEDFRLSQFLQRAGHDVVNFNHIRSLSSDFV